jgi:hypothetical protein
MSGFRPARAGSPPCDKPRKPKALLLEKRQHLAFERPIAEGLAMEMRDIEDARVRRCGGHADFEPAKA